MRTSDGRVAYVGEGTLAMPMRQPVPAGTQDPKQYVAQVCRRSAATGQTATARSISSVWSSNRTPSMT